MKKTALQEVFNLLEELHPSFFDVHTEKGRAFINTFHKFIEIEKEHIINAFNEGESLGDRRNYTGIIYYNETFKSE